MLARADIRYRWIEQCDLNGIDGRYFVPEIRRRYVNVTFVSFAAVHRKYENVKPNITKKQAKQNRLTEFLPGNCPRVSTSL
jgi:hypothetical protein